MPRHPNILEYTGTEPITLAEAKQYLRIDSSFTDDDAYITNLIPIARITVTKDTNQVVVKETIEEQFDNWQNGIIQLSYPGKLSEVSVSYRQTIATAVTMTADTDYVLGVSNPLDGRIEIINRPALATVINGVRILYKSEPDGADSTKPLLIAMYMLIQHWYDHRSPVKHLQTYVTPIGYQKLVNNYKQFI